MSQAALATHRSTAGYDLTPPSPDERRRLEAGLTREGLRRRGMLNDAGLEPT